jgi:pimeloyl-ACP methyl ester carboxylesterase
MQSKITYIYLHGFASSPQSRKAQYFHHCFTQWAIDLIIPDLNQPNFTTLTLTRQIEQTAQIILAQNNPVILIGSSFGGLTSAILAQKYSQQVSKIVLLAPAFDFVDHWLPLLGEHQLKHWQQSEYLSVYHYGAGQSLLLHYQFVIDSQQYSSNQLTQAVPTLILHGKTDETIPIQSSRDYAQKRPWVELIELNTDHGMGDMLAQLWQATARFISA